MRKYIFFFIGVLFYIGIIPIFLYGQSLTDIEKAARQSDHFDYEKIEEKLKKIPDLPTEIKPEELPSLKKKEETFFVKKINVVGCESISVDSLSFLLARYENRELSLSDLEGLAKKIEYEYLRRGIISAVFVPPQEIKEGIVILQVIEARFDQLKIQKHSYFRESRLRYYWNIQPGEILRYDKIYKSLQLMNKNPDRQVKASLFAGERPGTTGVLLSPKTNFPIHFISSYDKEGSPYTGRTRLNFGIQHNNFLGFDDIFIVGRNLSKSLKGKYYYHNLPITNKGTYLLYGYNQSDYKLGKEYGRYRIKTELENTSFSLRQDLYRKDKYLGEIYIGIEAKDKTLKMRDYLLNRDRLRILKLGGNIIKRGFGSSTHFSLDFSQGVSAFGASPDDNPYASRGAKPTFSKLLLGLRYRKIFPFGWQANLRVRGQVSSRKLTPQEQFSLGGIDSVRGYPSGDYSADTATQETVELFLPNFFIPTKLKLPYAAGSLKNQSTLLLFVDHGWGKKRGALETEKKSVNLLSIGAGLRFNFFDQALLRLEWGFPLASNRAISESANSYFHFSVDLQEKLPQEIQRISKVKEEEKIDKYTRKLTEEVINSNEVLKKKLEEWRSLAQRLKQQGRLEEAKNLSEKIIEINNSLSQQLRQIIEGIKDKEKELIRKHKLASIYYQQGRISEAKKLWEEIIKEAKEIIMPQLLKI